ncbi:hypothetical protein ACFQ51_32140 [Streptomyces kaempferi]
MTRVIMVRHLVAALATVLTLATPCARADTGPGPAPGGDPAAGTLDGHLGGRPSGTAPARPGASIRNVVHTSVGGEAVRVRLSNRLGTEPLLLGAVTVALQEPGSPRDRTPSRDRCGR